MYLCLHLYLFIYLYLTFCPSPYLVICQRLHIYLSIFYLSICLSILSLSIYIHNIYIYIYLYLHMYMYEQVYIVVFVPFHLTWQSALDCAFSLRQNADEYAFFGGDIFFSEYNVRLLALLVGQLIPLCCSFLKTSSVHYLKKYLQGQGEKDTVMSCHDHSVLLLDEEFYPCVFDAFSSIIEGQCRSVRGQREHSEEENREDLIFLKKRKIEEIFFNDIKSLLFTLVSLLGEPVP